MSIFILGNKNLKGGWRNLMIVLYTTNAVWLLVTAVLNINKMVTEEGLSFLAIGWVIIGLLIIIAQILFHQLVNRKIKS